MADAKKKKKKLKMGFYFEIIYNPGLNKIAKNITFISQINV